jgi:hypothetical protein
MGAPKTGFMIESMETATAHNRKRKKGISQPFYEKQVMNMPGVARLKRQGGCRPAADGKVRFRPTGVPGAAAP